MHLQQFCCIDLYSRTRNSSVGGNTKQILTKRNLIYFFLGTVWKIILLKYPSQLLLVSNVPLSASNSFFPSVPEFQPGVPWKGIQNIDPESDPYVTPGSVLGGTATSPIVDTDHQLLRDNTTGKTVNSWHMITYV